MSEPRTEPRFMHELHQTRAQLSREWRAMSGRQILASLRHATARLRTKSPARPRRRW